MGVSLITALTIQANGAQVAVGQGPNGKYGFEIYSIIREHYRPHLTSEPSYDSKEIAKEDGENLLREIMALDLNEHRKRASDLIGDEAGLVEKIISASKEGR